MVDVCTVSIVHTVLQLVRSQVYSVLWITSDSFAPTAMHYHVVLVSGAWLTIVYDSSTSPSSNDPVQMLSELDGWPGWQRWIVSVFLLEHLCCLANRWCVRILMQQTPVSDYSYWLHSLHSQTNPSRSFILLVIPLVSLPCTIIQPLSLFIPYS